MLACQTYPHWHATLISDASTDSTNSLLADYIQTHSLEDKVTFIVNAERRGALYNIVSAARNVPGHKVICLYDGDDWLANEQVLDYYAYLYTTYNTWLTYGQFVEFPSRAIGFCTPYSIDTIRNNEFRTIDNIPSHLRTFYAWLFHLIPEDALKKDGEFYRMTWDQAIMFPMIEMAGERHLFVPQATYIYNSGNPINDHKVDGELQSSLAREIKAKERFQRLENEPESQMGKAPCQNVYFTMEDVWMRYMKGEQ